MFSPWKNWSSLTRNLGLSHEIGTINLSLLYETVMDRVSDFDGLAFWDGMQNDGMTIFEISKFFISSPEFIDKFGSNLSTEEIVNLAYNHILERDADEEGQAFWVTNMDNGTFAFEDVFAHFAVSPEVKNLFSNQIDDGVLLTV